MLTYVVVVAVVVLRVHNVSILLKRYMGDSKPLQRTEKRLQTLNRWEMPRWQVGWMWLLMRDDLRCCWSALTRIVSDVAFRMIELTKRG